MYATKKDGLVPCSRLVKSEPNKTENIETFPAIFFLNLNLIEKVIKGKKLFIPSRPILDIGLWTASTNLFSSNDFSVEMFIQSRGIFDMHFT
jgi:hypothetical protein